MRSAVLTLVVNGLLERSVTLQLATQDGTATGMYTVYVMGIYLRPIHQQVMWTLFIKTYVKLFFLPLCIL